MKRYPDGLPLLDPIEDMGIQDAGMVEAVQAVEGLEKRLAVDPVFLVSLVWSYHRPYVQMAVEA